MEKLFIANFKMNKTTSEIEKYISEFQKLLPTIYKNKIVLCVPYCALGLNKTERICLGAQNVFEEEKGSFTGEISAEMLKDLGAEYVLVGHSERRKHFHETNQNVNKKIKLLLKHGLKVVLCVGEKRAERNSGKTNQILKTQIEEALCGIYENELSSIIIAYEPVWAIGTGKVATNADIYNATKLIKDIISSHYSQKAGNSQKIVYGGSINSTNSKLILQTTGITGLLVGGASLCPKEFSKIVIS